MQRGILPLKITAHTVLPGTLNRTHLLFLKPLFKYNHMHHTSQEPLCKVVHFLIPYLPHSGFIFLYCSSQSDTSNDLVIIVANSVYNT